MNVKEALCVLEEQASGDRSLMISNVDDRNHAQYQLATTTVRLKITERALTADFDQLNRYSGSSRAGKFLYRP